MVSVDVLVDTELATTNTVGEFRRGESLQYGNFWIVGGISGISIHDEEKTGTDDDACGDEADNNCEGGFGFLISFLINHIHII